ncbi:hypothetical protein [Rhodoligotrophos defluvii]|uniref:hypothetical protein n=1 Tax=Rhodoligotrophos defluvii TaxID=2561934 RepID=UPI0010C9591E|nr:hypothetical protein [Rhodoligotrophos defluvii]
MFKRHFSGLAVALIVGTTSLVASHAAEQFIPQGFVYGPGRDELPPLNSEQDRIDARAAVRETEIWKSQYRERYLIENMQRLLDHDFSTPNQLNSAW